MEETKTLLSNNEHLTFRRSIVVLDKDGNSNTIDGKKYGQMLMVSADMTANMPREYFAEYIYRQLTLGREDLYELIMKEYDEQKPS